MHHRRPRSSTPALSWRSSGPTTGDRGRHRDLGVAGCRRRCRLGGDTGVRSSESQDHGSLSRSCSTAPRCRSATPPPNRPLRPPARPTIQSFPTWRQAYPAGPPSTPAAPRGPSAGATLGRGYSPASRRAAGERFHRRHHCDESSRTHSCSTRGDRWTSRPLNDSRRTSCARR